ncbi:hypothetical protein ACLOJK_024944 [Asimina triloba]
MEKVAILLVLAIAATWVPTRLASRELSDDHEEADREHSLAPFAPFEEAESGDEEEKRNSNNGGTYSRGVEVELGRQCREQVHRSYLNGGRPWLTQGCCRSVRDVIQLKKPSCWDTMLRELYVDQGPFGRRLKAYCLGDLSKLPFAIIGDPQE